MILNISAVEPVRYTGKARFKFRCHKDISCFTRCCSRIDIMLTPYDIVVMKNRLKISSSEFLERYTNMIVDEKSSLPCVFLRMDRDKKCPFVTPEGCSIYEDRPVNCRYYPVGHGIIKKAVDREIVNEEFYFFLKEDHCKGFLEYYEWTIEEWLKDQGVESYDDINREWRLFQLRRNGPGESIDTKKQSLFYLACYDMDRFRRFIFESGFLNHFDVPESRVELVREDEIELLKLGFDLVKYLLMIEETFNIRQK
ncbi:MAG: YkgJ family cysteine cluster protein [Thermodesulfovibrionales bacterium]|nr:YkgJ family cysteine cluster protein [Thermodesulfovibrionales bacterium]